MGTRRTQVKRCQASEHAVPSDGAGAVAERGIHGDSLAVIGEGGQKPRFADTPLRVRKFPGHTSGQRRAGIPHGMLRCRANLLLTEADYTESISVRVTVEQWLAGALTVTAGA